MLERMSRDGGGQVVEEGLRASKVMVGLGSLSNGGRGGEGERKLRKKLEDHGEMEGRA